MLEEESLKKGMTEEYQKFSTHPIFKERYQIIKDKKNDKNIKIDLKLEDGLKLSKLVNSKGFSATLDLLGEEVHNRTETNKARDSYCELVEGIANFGIDCNVSLKLTALGLRINEELCWDNLSVVLDKAREYDNFVRLDMENSSVTQATINMCMKAKDYYPKCGTVLQAYMRRTVNDVEAIVREDRSHDTNLRLCKGAYKESSEIAYQGYQEVRDNYLDSARKSSLIQST